MGQKEHLLDKRCHIIGSFGFQALDIHRQIIHVSYAIDAVKLLGDLGTESEVKKIGSPDRHNR